MREQKIETTKLSLWTVHTKRISQSFFSLLTHPARICSKMSETKLFQMKTIPPSPAQRQVQFAECTTLFEIKTSEINFACLPRNFHKELSVCVRRRARGFPRFLFYFVDPATYFAPRAVITFSNFSHKISSELPRLHSLSSLQLFHFWKQILRNSTSSKKWYPKIRKAK